MKLSWKFISVAGNLSPPFLKLQTKTCHESVSVKSRAERVEILWHCITLHRILSSWQLSLSPSSQPSSSTLRNCYRRRYVVENFGLTWCAFEVKRYLLLSSLLHFISQLLFSWFPSFSSILLGWNFSHFMLQTSISIFSFMSWLIWAKQSILLAHFLYLQSLDRSTRHTGPVPPSRSYCGLLAKFLNIATKNPAVWIWSSKAGYSCNIWQTVDLVFC